MYAGIAYGEYLEKTLSTDLEAIVDGRGLSVYREGGEKYAPVSDSSSHFVRCAMPILSEGDLVGCVVSLWDGSDKGIPAQEIETKLIMTAAGFLGRQLEI